LSGDHVLPRITSNISVHSQQFPNPLGDFLDSLAKIGAFSPDEVLPAHEYRFKNLGVRIEHLVAHHEERLIEILQLLLTRGTTAWDLTRRLTWSRPFDQIQDFMQRAANGETLAHLVLLEERGLVQRSEGHPFIFTCTDSGRNLAS
jgi:glyoxylase-like metal-dependent hydrolase (beta-lactamase superfamily II)